MNNVSCISQPKMIFNKSLYNVDQPIDFWNRSINLFEGISEQVLTLFRMGGGPTSFSPVTSTNIRFGPQTFLTFSFNPFATLLQNFKFVFSASPKLLNLNEEHPSKKRFFWSNPYKIEVMITFFTEMLQLPNFGLLNTFTI